MIYRDKYKQGLHMTRSNDVTSQRAPLAIMAIHLCMPYTAISCDADVDCQR